MGILLAHLVAQVSYKERECCDGLFASHDFCEYEITGLLTNNDKTSQSHLIKFTLYILFKALNCSVSFQDIENS